MNITLEFCEECAKSATLYVDKPCPDTLKIKLCKKCEENLLKAFDEYREKVNKKEEQNESENDN